MINAGQYIDTHLWLYYIIGIITSFITYWLYLCAVTKSKKLSWQKCILILIAIGSTIGVSFLSPTISIYYGLIVMVVLPAIFNAELKTTAIVLSIHTISQVLSLEIRGLTRYILVYNSLALLVIGVESYFWLLLFYLYYNYKEV